MQFASPKIGYVLKRFPRVSETFIANEILELERQGMALEIYSLIDPAEAEPSQVVHGMLRELRSRIIYVPMKPVFKKWRVKTGYLDDRGFDQQLLRDMLGDETADRSAPLIQAGVVAQLAGAEGIGHLHAHFARE